MLNILKYKKVFKVIRNILVKMNGAGGEFKYDIFDIL
jgi:hypothetical protein